MLTLLLFISLFLNFLIIYIYKEKIITDVHLRYFAKPFFSMDTPDCVVVQQVINNAISIDKVIMSQQEYHGLFSDMKRCFQKKRNCEIINNFYTSYLYAGLSYYALKKNDLHIVKVLENKALSFIDSGRSCLNYTIKRIDQCPIGILYINLYYSTQAECYKIIADQIFNYLLAQTDSSYIIPYNQEEEHNYIDTLGMIVPFLMEYYKMTNNNIAKEIAIRNINLFENYCVDKQTGIPTHGYNTKTKIKIGSSNWGRGIGWYLLAKAYLEEPSHGETILNTTLVDLDYTQFPGSSCQFDSSVALLFELYKQKKNISKNSIDFIKSRIRVNGEFDLCSGDTYGFNDYSHTFGNSELCSGLFLMIISNYES